MLVLEAGKVLEYGATTIPFFRPRRVLTLSANASLLLCPDSPSTLLADPNSRFHALCYKTGELNLLKEMLRECRKKL